MQQGLFVYKYSYSLDACDSLPNSSSSVYSGLIRGSIATPSPSMSSSEHKKKGLTTVKTILNGISGSAAPGEILALMGPSGSGKTSMLDVLSGRSSYDGGSITLDGEIVTDKVMKKLKKRVAYVKQSDLFFGHLTVRDQLVYTAFLRLPNAWSKAQKIGEVDRIIRQASNDLQRVCWPSQFIQQLLICKLFAHLVNEQLRLEKCQHSPINMISGGEKKRVNIGSELLTDPSIIILDEPTSGELFVLESDKI